jgi:hypothetical protein
MHWILCSLHLVVISSPLTASQCSIGRPGTSTVADAISDLRAWGADQENSNWSKLVDKIHDTLKSKTSEAIQGVTPGNPFPAKTLVTALLSIVQLCIVHYLFQCGLIPVS